MNLFKTKMIKYFIIVMLTGCGAKAHHFLDAQEKCKDHKGVSELWPDLGSWHVRCLDGTKFFRVGEEK